MKQLYITLLAVAGMAMLLFMTPSAQATLLLYEPFAYTQDLSLDTLGTDGNGMTGTWTAGGTNDAAGGPTIQNALIAAEPADWDGALVGNLTGVTTTGRFAGMAAVGTDHLWGYRTLDTSVTDAFTAGTSTWISAIFSRTVVTGHSKPALSLGSGPLSQRAQFVAGEAGDVALGFGTNYNNSNGPIRAAHWIDANSGGDLGGKFFTDGGVGQKLGGDLGTNSQQLVVARIDWADGANVDTLSVYNFGENDTGGITKAIWDAATKSVHSVALDQTTFDTLSFGGSRYHIDEIRIGTTFEDIVTGTAVGPQWSADINDDGEYNDLDMQLLLSDYVSDGAGGAEGGPYNQENLNELLELFGSSVGDEGSSTVPEPGACLLLVLGLFGIAPIIRRRK